MPDFSVARESRGEVQIVRVTGDIDLGTAKDVEQTMEAIADERGAGAVVVDFTHVPFMDSIGLRLLIRARRRLERDGRRMVIAGCQRPVRRVFEFTKTDRQLDIVETADEAVRSAGG